MSVVTENQPDGTPTWIDLGIPDLERAMAFYGALFGWEFEVGPPEMMRYTQCLLGGRRVAGEGAAQLVALELAGQHRRAGDGREARGADEALRGLGLDHAHGVAGLGGQPRELERLVGGDPAGDAEEDARHRGWSQRRAPSSGSGS